MSFSLRITFNGLCLFAPDRNWTRGGAAKEERLHVVLVNHRHHPHVPHFFYNKAHESKGSTDYSNEWKCLHLSNCTLKLDDFGDPIDLWLPKQVVNAGAFVNSGKLKRTYVTNKNNNLVAARFTTNSGNFASCGRGARWIVGKGTPKEWRGEITTCVEWIIDVTNDGKLDRWKLEDCEFQQEESECKNATSLPTLYPIKGGIHLFVYNLPKHDERTGDAVEGEPAEHFDGYYDLLEASGPTPTIEDPGRPFYCLPEAITNSERGLSQLKEYGIMTPDRPTCVMARADVAP